MPSLIYYGLRCPVPLSLPLHYPILVVALAPAHCSGTRSHTHARAHSIDITPTANSHLPPQPTHQTTPPLAQYTLVSYVLSFSEQSMEKEQTLKFHDVYD